MFNCIAFMVYVIIGIETFGKNAVVCGRSKNVGMPIAMLLHADGIYETKAGMVVLLIKVFNKTVNYILAIWAQSKGMHF
jgi:5,10-methylene-tetrahydrofolate dehydrogenase/methenyl tetrahydrofolate cyclohydrolase